MYTQHPYRCRLDWGRHGTRLAAERGDILVIVDTLSFSTATVTALHHGGIIYPCSQEDDPVLFAQRIGGEIAVNRREVPAKGRFSLSPATLETIEAGTRVVLASPNGATCSRYARQVPYLFVGTLVNAEAVAAAVSSLLLAQPNLSATIIACGERWHPPTEDGSLRIAIEDYLGAGAILSSLPYDKSPEARVCEGAFLSSKDDLAALLWDCGSGRELRAIGFEHDIAQSRRVEARHRVGHRTLPRQHHARRIADDPGIPGDDNARVGSDMHERLRDRAQVAHAVVDHCYLKHQGARDEGRGSRKRATRIATAHPSWTALRRRRAGRARTPFAARARTP